VAQAVPVVVVNPGEFEEAFESIRKTGIGAMFVGWSRFF
jgi:hypothetical protein